MRHRTLDGLLWVKMKRPGDRGFFFMFPFARVEFWVPIFDPQPVVLFEQFFQRPISGPQE